MRLSVRIGLAVGCTVPLLVLAFGWLLLQLVARDLHRAADEHLQDRAAAIVPDARALLRAGAAGRSRAADNRERALYSAALDVGVRVVGPDGSFSAGPQPGSGVALPERTGAPVTVPAEGGSWRVLARPVRTSSASGTLWVFARDTADPGQLQLVRRRVLVTTVLAAPLSGVLAWGMSAGAAAPLRRLTRRTAGLDPRADRARPLLERTGLTEVDELAATVRTVLARYDEQAARTAQALDTARSFSAAAAHELRTPLMSMGTNLDILAVHSTLAEADRAEVVDDLRREHSRLLGLLLMLRDLGRGDLVEAEAFRIVDLTEIAEAAVAEVRRREPGAVVALDAPAGISVRGWEPGLRLLVDNLLANAVAHGADTLGRVRVRVGMVRVGEWIVLTVDDGGPGVPGQDRQRIFERFRRGPSSAGTGLGLTLVAQQAALHRGSVTVADAPGAAGARFEVRLPAGEGELPERRDWLIGTARTYRSQDFPKKGS
ncbi:HAMP domain-containing sensor histidine kinase [Streptomyces sp. NPDC051907]|uniref:HAMP domain-containing sensor histidine kinase n=1 Tax=Streptomyces sp. NPDC051907 TaxID=3155284 RepID=UPI00342ACBB2